jgi:hypothetical protein
MNLQTFLFAVLFWFLIILGGFAYVQFVLE